MKNRTISINENNLKNIISNSIKTVLKENNLMPNTGGKYTYEILDSFEDAQKWFKPTSPGAWCNTYGKYHFDSYIRKFKGHYVVFIQDGWQNIKRPKDPRNEEGWSPEKPQDAYGNSLIIIVQSDKSPEPVITCSRWNHGTDDITRCEADHAYTKEELERITGISLEKVYIDWKKNHKVLNKKPTTRSIMRINENKLNKIIKSTINDILNKN